MLASYLFVVIIINTTATIEIVIPIIMLLVRGSPKTKVPTIMAVIGSKTSRIEAFVAPIFLVATASVAVDIIVGKMARHTKLNQSSPVSMPVVISAPEVMSFAKKIIAPKSNA